MNFRILSRRPHCCPSQYHRNVLSLPIVSSDPKNWIDRGSSWRSNSVRTALIAAKYPPEVFYSAELENISRNGSFCSDSASNFTRCVR